MFLNLSKIRVADGGDHCLAEEKKNRADKTTDAMHWICVRYSMMTIILWNMQTQSVWSINLKNKQVVIAYLGGRQAVRQASRLSCRHRVQVKCGQTEQLTTANERKWMNNKSWVAYLPSAEYTFILILESVKGGSGGSLWKEIPNFPFIILDSWQYLVLCAYTLLPSVPWAISFYDPM